MKINKYNSQLFDKQSTLFDYYFPLLIRRAVEGWNKNHHTDNKMIIIYSNCITCEKSKCLKFEDYQPQSLTQAECAMLHCMLDIFKGEGK